jgi:hypothetical protein
MTVINVIETNPIKNSTSAQRSKCWLDCGIRMAENESNALIINNTLSTANALSIKKLVRPGFIPLTILITVMQTPTIVAEFGKIWCDKLALLLFIRWSKRLNLEKSQASFLYGLLQVKLAGD